MKDAAVILAFVVLVPVSLWFWFAGPCELYAFTATGEVPARCLMEGAA